MKKKYLCWFSWVDIIYQLVYAIFINGTLTRKLKGVTPMTNEEMSIETMQVKYAEYKDIKRMMEEFPQIFSEYQKSSTYIRFSIS